MRMAEQNSLGHILDELSHGFVGLTGVPAPKPPSWRFIGIFSPYESGDVQFIEKKPPCCYQTGLNRREIKMPAVFDPGTQPVAHPFTEPPIRQVLVQRTGQG